MSSEKLDYRIMGDYSIAKSFKGILRIAHIMELVENEKDEYFNSTYYGNPSSLMDISGAGESSKVYGFPNPSEGFEGKVKRYISEKLYKDKKLPVTDSMGNYLNWNLGTEDSTIGSDIDNNGYILKDNYVYQKEYEDRIIQPLVFPVLESKELIIGLEPKVIDGEKKYFSGDAVLNFPDGEKTQSLVVTNLYDHSDLSVRTEVNNDKIEEVEGEYVYNPSTIYNHRTIYKNTKKAIEEYDAFAYCQENYNFDNYNYNYSHDLTDNHYNKNYNGGYVKEHTSIDAEVDIINLKDYVKDIIKKFMSSNVVEVPTGTVIYQYISPEKWYGIGDTGNGDILSKTCMVGHRPTMQQRNYETDVIISEDGNKGTKWSSSTLQGVSYKTNRLNLGDNVVKEKSEDEEDDSAFETTKLEELIPLYKRDYLLCDGSTYYIPLSEYNKNRDEVKRKYLAYDRFIDLFYTIGYNYTYKNESLSDDYSIFSSIKERYEIGIDDSDGQKRFRYYYKENGERGFINKTNYFKYNEEKGTPLIISWNDDKIKNLKDAETLYGTDLITMVTYRLLLEEDAKDINSVFIENGKYNRTKAENWLKKQSIPLKYIFNSFVYDNKDTLSNYEDINGNDCLTENDVLVYPYVTNGLDEAVNLFLGREVNSYTSKIKYFVPDENGGRYVVCEVWQIAEIQYILDVLEAGSGERNNILPYRFNYRFKVPNLTNCLKPKFIGSSGFNWRDQAGSDLETEGMWTSSMTVGTSPHRHAIFKGHLNGFPENDKRKQFSGSVLRNNSLIPSSSVNLHTRSSIPEGGTHYDESGSYIWNELGPLEGLRYEPDKKMMGIKMIQRGPFDVSDKNTPLVKNNEKYYIQDNDKDNGAGELIGPGTTGLERYTSSSSYYPSVTSFQKTGELRGKPSSYKEYPSPNETSYNEFKVWFNSEKNKWYSFDLCEDPRFDNCEPNRCITGPPINFDVSKYIKYTKNDLNMRYSPSNSSYYFSPENVKALPLIKL